MWISLTSIGTRTANPEQSAQALQRWVSHLLSENNKKWILDWCSKNIFEYTIILFKVLVMVSTGDPCHNQNCTYFKPAACHNAIDLFIGQLGAVEAQAPGHLSHNF